MSYCLKQTKYVFMMDYAKEQEKEEKKEKEKKEKEKKEKSFSALPGNLDEGEKPPDELGQFLKDTVFKYTF